MDSELPSDEQRKKALEHLARYRMELDSLYALGVEAGLGLGLYHKDVKKDAARSRRQDRIKPEDRKMFYGMDNPNNADATFQDVITRTANKGSHRKKLYQAAIVFAYMHWEDDVRNKFATELGKSSKGITSDIFGDLGKYRHAIAHNNGVLRKTPNP